MLEVKNISKIYRTDEVELKALDGVSVNLRKNEFVSILGPSGSGKTTLLNIIGGLDRYTSGDLIIDGVSTKDYTQRDWDAYRNYRVGFVFQSYNLIGHQSILQNVELALTLSGVSGAERKRRAEEALKEVGLSAHMNKRPSQLSGGQMQRVAIARALVNDPDIILADEPTGALDSKTSVKIMEILKKIAKDKLVVMVTHNPELAEKYSTRIITVKDGRIIGDTDPYDGKDGEKKAEKLKYTSLSLPTALALSFNNLRTKRGRTIMTAIAGSIGIVGIALILALANGLNEQAVDLVKGGSLASEITVDAVYQSDSVTLSSDAQKKEEVTREDGTVIAKDDMSGASYVTKQDRLKRNDTKSLKEYIEKNKDELAEYTEKVQYAYGLDLQVYDKNAEGQIVKINPIKKNNVTFAGLDLGIADTSDVTVEGVVSSSFKEIISNKVYDLMGGKLPEADNELLLVVNEKGELPLTTMYALNLQSRSELDKIISQLNNGVKPEFADVTYKVDDIVGKTYKVVPSDETGATISEGEYNAAKELKVVGVAKVKDSNDYSGYMGYTSGLAAEMAPESAKQEPEKISIYPKSEGEKEKITAFLDKYNDGVGDVQKIHYEDQKEASLNAIKTVVNMISGVLIAFVAISLVVSSIMIGIITYISVLERTKEIGILRAIGASKSDVVRVFRAETIIEGLVAGVLGVVVSGLICLAVNAIVSATVHVDNIANLSLLACVILIAISVGLTVLAGAIPAKRASKKDPVEALRSE